MYLIPLDPIQLRIHHIHHVLDLFPNQHILIFHSTVLQHKCLISIGIFQILDCIN
jgi:hypothetical protein